MRRCILLAITLFTASLTSAQSSLPSQHNLSDDVANACKKILATAPQPPAEPTGSFQLDCDSAAYYFGIGRPRDFVAARRCAYVERTKPSETDSNIFYGPGVLSMIYANGEGTPRNIALARRFTCENSWAAPGELEGRLDLLKQIASAAHPQHFDLCDTATSGLSEGWCESITTRKSDAVRNTKIEEIKSSLPATAQASFHQLQAAEDRFEDLRVKNEIDLSGTGRAAFSLEEQTALRNQFLSNLKMLQKPMPATPASFISADQELNTLYAKVRKTLPPAESEKSDYGTINFAGVRETQRAWVQLRDSWIAFVKLAYPSLPFEQVAATLTIQRTHQLREFVP
jgi:hypothetical protein